MAKGQHIFVRRPNGWVTRGMLHHGVDLGDGTVIHFTGHTNKDAEIIRTNIKIFENNGEIKAFPYDQIGQFAANEFGEDVSKAIARNYYKLGEQVPPPDVKPRDPDDVVSEALKWLGTTGWGGQYHPSKNNCEHFATGCATGYPFSLQVQYVKEYLHYRPSLGGLLSVLFTESRRFYLNPRPKPKDGWYFIGATYRTSKSEDHYQEYYSKPGDLPPKWFMCKESTNQCQVVDQKIVPYPLTQVAHHYVDQHGRTRSDKISK